MEVVIDTNEVRTFTLTQEEVLDAIERRMRANDNLAGGPLQDPVLDAVNVQLFVSNGSGVAAKVKVTHTFPRQNNEI